MTLISQQISLDSGIFPFLPLFYFMAGSVSNLFLTLQVFSLDITRTILLGILYVPFSKHFDFFLCMQYSKILHTDVIPQLVLVRHISGSLTHYALIVSRMSLLYFCLLACFDS
jgi:hypothetical protein